MLLDDRDKKTSPGIKFADMELIGIPHRIVVSIQAADRRRRKPWASSRQSTPIRLMTMNIPPKTARFLLATHQRSLSISRAYCCKQIGRAHV